AVAEGETIDSIAQKYNLIPATLLAFNPVLQQGPPPVGTQLVVPPYNGIAVRIPEGKTWKDVADNYNIRADALFEANGCQLLSGRETPEILFLPGVNWSPGGRVRPAVSVLRGYPLPFLASPALGYGWLLHPLRGEVIFHSGLDLLAEMGTPVLSVGEGIVAFADRQNIYGNLVVINHPAGKQTRYAHLDSINVRVGQKVKLGEVLGTVGTSGEPELEEPHLHFEIRYNSPFGWIAENPDPYFIDDLERLGASQF
ncbi:MAG: M23 family metallopeptidase, partial [Okeania sp. SIO2H7]|nr:M23 family metallopeptidase [Okeania sp. SIO2H7]